MNYARVTPDNAAVEPYRALGLKRIGLILVFTLIASIAVVGTMYSLYMSLTLTVAMLLIAYLLDNFIFVFQHLGLHSAFMEMPEKTMSTITHQGFIHHYRDVRVFQNHWLEYRLSYFFCSRQTYRHPFVRVITLVQAGFCFAFFLLNPLLAICLLSVTFLARLLQGLAHEWFHVRNRRAFYSKPLYWLLSFLEFTNVISTKNHTRHHRHQLENLDEVETWTDMYVPGLDALGAFFWRRVLEKHQPGKLEGMKYCMKLYLSVLAIRFATFALCLLSFHAYWL